MLLTDLSHCWMQPEADDCFTHFCKSGLCGGQQPAGSISPQDRCLPSACYSLERKALRHITNIGLVLSTLRVRQRPPQARNCSAINSSAHPWPAAVAACSSCLAAPRRLALSRLASRALVSTLLRCSCRQRSKCADLRSCGLCSPAYSCSSSGTSLALHSAADCSSCCIPHAWSKSASLP